MSTLVIVPSGIGSLLRPDKPYSSALAQENADLTAEVTALRAAVASLEARGQAPATAAAPAVVKSEAPAQPEPEAKGNDAAAAAAVPEPEPVPEPTPEPVVVQDDGSNAYALFNLLDADGDGSLNNMELIDFSSSHNINVSTLTTALGLTGKKKEISKADFFTKYQNGELDFLKDIKTDLSRAKRNSVKRKKKEVNMGSASTDTEVDTIPENTA